MAGGKHLRAGGGSTLRSFYSWLGVLVRMTAAVVLVSLLLFRVVLVDGPSMRETLQNGDCLLMVRSPLCGEPKAGDIVVIRKDTYGEEPIIKRVIATEGQTVDIDFDAGVVSVDGKALDEPYTLEPTYLEEGLAFPVTVPEGCVFVLGDNRNDSTDSRDPRLGPIDSRYLLGRAVLLLLPGRTADAGERDFSRIGLLD